MAYDSYLKSQHLSEDICWQKNEKDPPDFWLTLSDQKFAVEVTTLMEGVGRDGRKRREVFDRIGEFERRLNERLIGVKPSHGTYIVTMIEALPLDRKSCSELLDNTVREVKHICANDLKGRFRIRHSDRPSITVHLVSHPDPWTFRYPTISGFPVPEANKILSVELKKKTQKLRKAGVPRPWVLLLWLDACLVDPRHYQELRDIPKEIEEFETVYAVPPGGTGFLLQPRGDGRANSSVSRGFDQTREDGPLRGADA